MYKLASAMIALLIVVGTASNCLAENVLHKTESGIKSGASKVGSTVKKGAEDVAHGVEKGAVKTGSAVKKGAVGVTHGVEKGASKTGSLVKKGVHETEKAGSEVKEKFHKHK